MIYFIRCGADGPIKIGFTDGDAASRLVYLQCGCPWALSVMGTMDGDRAREVELHRAFNHLAIRGEWFHAANELLTFIAANSNESRFRRAQPPQGVDEIACAGVVSAFGGPSKVALAINEIGGRPITPQAVSQWKRIPADRAVAVESITGISRHELRPDVFGVETAA